LKQLLEGLALSAIVIATIAGALLLSGRETIAQPVVSPPSGPIVSATPTASATATPMPTSNAIALTPTIIQQVTATSSATSTATPSPTATVCPTPIGWQPYTVGPFDTLFSLAAQFNLTPEALAQANCLSGTVISAGQTIYVPSTTPTATAVPCNPPYWWVTYIVQSGDTLSSLAVRYNISVYQLQQANCLTSTFIYAGQILRVPPIVVYPTFTPTFIPTLIPSATPTDTPTATPTDTPTATPTATPDVTIEPTVEPTIEPPSPTPTDTPTPTPTDTPTIEPPSPTPTDTPTNVPPTDIPTLAPSDVPTAAPTTTP
jgi:LysM repeat protein